MVELVKKEVDLVKKEVEEALKAHSIHTVKGKVDNPEKNNEEGSHMLKTQRQYDRSSTLNEHREYSNEEIRDHHHFNDQYKHRSFPAQNDYQRYTTEEKSDNHQFLHGDYDYDANLPPPLPRRPPPRYRFPNIVYDEMIDNRPYIENAYFYNNQGPLNQSEPSYDYPMNRCRVQRRPDSYPNTWKHQGNPYY